VLYLIADFLYIVFYYVLGYRKDVVLENLRNSFPDKNEAELKRIRKAFFHHLSDMFLETFKTLTISPQNMLRRCGISPVESIV
jgi:KDO2-lipid IV(A) lauroyltransferase